MLVFVVVAVIIAACVLGLRYDEYDVLQPLCFACGIIALCAEVCMLLSTITLSSEFAYTEAQYNNLKKQVEYADQDDIVTDANLRNQVLEMNNTISEHKCYSSNIWIGVWYSERIGNLEPLKWKSNK